MPLDVTGDMVASVSKRLLGSVGPGENALVRLHYWLLRFESASEELRNIVGELGEWMSNGRQPWVAYRVLMLVCLISLDKFPWITASHSVRDLVVDAHEVWVGDDGG